MYFDDPERLEGQDDILSSDVYHANWIMSYSEEKRLALQNVLGYQPSSAARLNDEQVEEETLRWAIDTNIVWVDDDMEEDAGTDSQKHQPQKQRHGKYDSIQDVKIASSCDTVLESLAYCWSVIADVLQEQQKEDQKNNGSSTTSSAQLVVFPRSLSLWDYDAMVNMLLAIQISKPFLPPEYNLQLDLFHPRYKHSPRMWSPEMHAPFPTLGISLKHTKKEEMELDIDATRAKLDKLFQSMDANREYVSSPENLEDVYQQQQILQECMAWLSSKQQVLPDNMEWTIHTSHVGTGGPFQLYKTLWNTILTLSSSSSMVIVPSLDSHTLHRIAVTVNAALIRLEIPVRIAQVYTPFPMSTRTNKDSSLSPPPYGMIQLSLRDHGI
jgi:hypothetical protein